MQRVLLIGLFLYSFVGAAADTELKLYRPFAHMHDHPAPKITQVLKGECYSQSQRILREDAWRCQAGGMLFDPCFAHIGKKIEVLCPQSPWVGAHVQIEVQTPMDTSHHVALDMSRTYPWGVVLENGAQCLSVETQVEYDSMPVRYVCGAEHARTRWTDNALHQAIQDGRVSVLFGYVQRCRTEWSMLEKNAQGVATVVIKQAWF